MKIACYQIKIFMKFPAYALVAMVLFAACSRPKTTYTIKAKSRQYVSFFGKYSWWQYGIEGRTDTFRWTAWSAILATMQSDPQYQIFTSFTGAEDTHTTNDCDYGVQAGIGGDNGSINGMAMHFTITANDTSITGSGNLPMENNVVAGGITYNNVLHLRSSDTLNYHIYSDVWVAPNVGIIKMLRRDDTCVYYLKAYNITPVNNDM
jgi:hypothetical protein